MPTPAQQKLAEYGLTIDVAHAYVMERLGQPGTILDVARTYGITNAMLGEIAGWPQDAYPASTVVSYFANQGFDSTVLDTPYGGGGGGGGGRVSVVGDPTVTEGVELIYLVQLASPSTGHMDLPATLVFGTASAADIGQVYATNGVLFTDGAMHIFDAGLTSFEVHIVTVDDTTSEPFETVLLTIDGVTGTGYIADNDAQRAALVGVAGGSDAGA